MIVTVAYVAGRFANGWSSIRLAARLVAPDTGIPLVPLGPSRAESSYVVSAIHSVRHFSGRPVTAQNPRRRLR